MDEVKWRKVVLQGTLVRYQAMSDKYLAPPAKMVLGQEEIEDLFKKRRMAEVSDGMIKYAYTPSVKEKSELMFTDLEGKKIACFDIGGETRLCLIQVLQNVLIGLKLHEITPIFEELKVFLPLCTSDQLNSLKEKFIIPKSTRECGLITKSDAQRLCSFLRNKQADEKSCETSETHQSHRFKCTFKVVHNCFGGCEGIFIKDLFHSTSQKCIECVYCHQLFTPEYFVSHVHEFFENKQTCHWGFDSSNWTHYLFVDPSEADDKEDILNKIKKQFSHVDEKSLPFPPPIDIHNLPFASSKPPMEAAPAILEERHHSDSEFPPNVSLVVSKDSTTLPFNCQYHDVVNKYTKEEEVRSDDDDDDDDMPHVDDDAERDEKEFQRLNILSRHLNLQSPVCDIIRDYQRLCRRLMKGASMEKHPPNKNIFPTQPPFDPPIQTSAHLSTQATSSPLLDAIQVKDDSMVSSNMRFEASLPNNKSDDVPPTDANKHVTASTTDVINSRNPSLTLPKKRKRCYTSVS